MRASPFSYLRTPVIGVMTLAVTVIALFYLLSYQRGDTDVSRAPEPDREQRNTQPVGATNEGSTQPSFLERKQQAIAQRETYIPEIEDARLKRVNGITWFLPATQPVEQLLSESGIESDTGQRVEVLDNALANYRFIFRENPAIMDNASLVAALTGKNAHNTVFFPPSTPLLKNGELIDEWGNPFIFHPISGKEIEIRSMGPDGELWTDDDLEF